MHLLITSREPTLLAALRPQPRLTYRVTAIENADSLPAAIAIHRPDAILLSLVHSNNVLETCQRLRTWSSIPLVAIGGPDVRTTVEVLNAGADDCVPQAFDVEELLARIRAIQRRLASRATSPAPVVRVGELTIDLYSRKVWR